MALLLIFIFFILPVVAVATYHHYTTGNQPTYDINETILNYEIIGSGENKLILLHGLTGSLNYWKRELDSISKTHSLLLIDLLGFGDSPKPKSEYSLDIQLKELEKIIIQEGYNDGEAFVAGHSMGAIISLALLEKHPHWFITAIFISIPYYKDANEFKKIMSTHSFVDRVSTSKFSKYICMIHPVFMSRAFKPDNLTDDVYKDAQKHHWMSYYYSLTEVILKTDLYTLANRVKDKEILFIHGEKDTTAPIENAIRLSKVFTNAKVVTSTEGDHQFFLKESDFVWQTIRDFSLSEKQKIIFDEN